MVAVVTWPEQQRGCVTLDAIDGYVYAVVRYVALNGQQTTEKDSRDTQEGRQTQKSDLQQKTTE